MSTTHQIQAETVIAGGGLAGIVTAYELLERGRRVLLIDKDTQEKFGGLAKESFGGVHMIDTPAQRRMKIKDSPELAWRDWEATAEFEPGDHWPRKWAQYYCEHSIPHIYEFLTGKGVEFLPLVNWPERGVFVPGNTLPRWHIALGTGHEIIDQLTAALDRHPRRANLTTMFGTEINGIEIEAGRATGLRGRSMKDGSDVTVRADHVVIASGGMCGGDLSYLRAHWHKPWGDPPEKLLNGAHNHGDGMLHEKVREVGGNLTHLDLQWHYAAGVHHPAKRRPNDGLSLVPPRSALWLNARGERIMNPTPMPTYGDTRHMVASVLKEPGQYSWQVMNWKIAIKELAVSGCDYMTAFRRKKKIAIALSAVLGNKELVNKLINDCPEDIVVADRLEDLMDKMQARSLYGLQINREAMTRTIRAYDAQIDRGPAYFNDDQLRRIMNFRTYVGDKIRVCKFQKIDDPKARPLIAIREFILARKSLGGIQTDLQCRVLREGDGEPIPGLYAVGEAAGFGGGGIHGKSSLEGTFLGGCVLGGRLAGEAIAAAC